MHQGHPQVLPGRRRRSSRSGDRDFKFFIVKSGEIQIVDHSGDAPKTVVVHRKGQFTGDVSHLTGRASVISAVARGACEVVEVSGEALRGALNQCPALSDVVLQAFIARRRSCASPRTSSVSG